MSFRIHREIGFEEIGMKIKVRPLLSLDAEQYEPGMEDGFDKDGVAYINGPFEKEPVEDGLWIVHGPACRFVRTQKQLDRDYEKIDA
jgi:hypothetical protein